MMVRILIEKQCARRRAAMCVILSRWLSDRGEKLIAAGHSYKVVG